MLEQQRFCGDGADVTTAEEFREGDEQVNREEKQFAHGWNAITPATLRKTALQGPLGLRFTYSPWTGQIRRTLSGAITDEQLVLQQQGLCGDGTDTTWADQLREGDQ